MKLKIKVTKAILERSKMCGWYEGLSESANYIAENCAIALAVREIFPNAAVSSSCIRERSLPNIGNLNYPSMSPQAGWYIPLPEEAIKFIELFDSMSPTGRTWMRELEFEVTLTDEILATINISEVKEALKTSKTLELI